MVTYSLTLTGLPGRESIANTTVSVLPSVGAAVRLRSSNFHYSQSKAVSSKPAAQMLLQKVLDTRHAWHLPVHVCNECGAKAWQKGERKVA